MKRKTINYILITVVIPVLVILGVVLFKDRKYAVLSIIIAFISCIPFLYKYEKRTVSGREIVITAVMTAISVSGRFVFAALPGFKPVTAVVVITAIYFGAEAGFVTGAMSAIVSNIFFGQGPWTPFQMFVWGILGFAAGVTGEKTNWFKNRIFMCFYAAIAGVAFSLMMDVWTVMAMDGIFNFARYRAAVISSLPFMAVYALSNIIFLLLLEPPIGKKLQRIKVKYGL